MKCEDNFSFTFEQSGSSSRTDAEPHTLYDTNSRDSGFDEVPLECLGDDAFLEEFSEINFSERLQLPTDFRNLIEKPIVSTAVSQKSVFRRVSSEENTTHLKKKICQRSESDSQDFFIRRKKIVRKSRTEECSSSAVAVKNHQLKSFSSNDIIKSAIQRSYSEPDLIADFSRSYSLPLTASRHQDLRAIDSGTLKKLLNGEFSDRIGSFNVIDCRYPYEYNGGHISGAINVYTHHQCSSLLKENSEKPNVLIFHCEFSSERGPNLYRHLRQEDRRKHTHMYPSLCFPEIYILEGGYRKFFEENACMCSPVAYTQMLDPKYSQDLVFFRQTSKTFNSDIRSSIKKNIRNKSTRTYVLRSQ